jgi:hypothetical protein
MHWGYLTALMVIGGLSALRPQTRKIGVALIGTWCLCTGAVYLTGDYTPWRVFAFANIAATVYIMRHPANKIGSVIGGTLLVQALIDLAYGAANNSDMAMQYLTIQDQIAWLQLALVGSWHVCGGVRRLWRYRNSQASAAYHARLAER